MFALKVIKYVSFFRYTILKHDLLIFICLHFDCVKLEYYELSAFLPNYLQNKQKTIKYILMINFYFHCNNYNQT